MIRHGGIKASASDVSKDNGGGENATTKKLSVNYPGQCSLYTSRHITGKV